MIDQGVRFDTIELSTVGAESFAILNYLSFQSQCIKKLPLIGLFWHDEEDLVP